MFYKTDQVPNKAPNKTMTQQKREFENILKFAQSTYENAKTARDINKLTYQENPLQDVVRLLARKIQGDFFFQLLCQENESQFDIILPSNSYYFFNTTTPLTINYETFDDLVIEYKIKKKILLCKDAILPSPWKRSRLVDTLSYIGEGRLKGSWKQDKQNHNVQLWYPMGLAWVESGNHSITSGIIQSVGYIETENVLDMSKVYDYVTCDGVNYIRRYDNKVIASVLCVEIAAIFEIGRIIKDDLFLSPESEF